MDSFPRTSVLLAIAGLPAVGMKEPSALSHCRVGVVTRNSSTVAVQVTERVSPAVVRGGEGAVTTGGGRAMQRKEIR